MKLFQTNHSLLNVNFYCGKKKKLFAYLNRILGATSPSFLAWSQVLRMMLRSAPLRIPLSSSPETVVTEVVTVVVVVPG